ncbi:hypothetical protein ACI6QG_01130 [Roseococcus sp. DSY-14]|uniref:hypothetical protein n=1 Tax=Roseococcus sp. DSY-14 TaxID=3369650 RepID=UPI00387B9D22
MRKLLVLPVIALLGLGACTDPYGRVDPVATGLLGAGIGAAAGIGIAAASQPRYPAYSHGPGWGHGGGWGRPVYAYRPAPRPYWGGGWGHRGW